MPKNILVGDIGSTKSTWWSNSEGNKEFLLTGYNPLAHHEGSGQQMFEQLWHVTEGVAFHQIWYYGTGVVNEAVAENIRDTVKKYFPGTKIEIASDLFGAAKAACGDRAGTVAILGTGSHAAVFDGHQIIRQAVSLGYQLGDEGGGCDIGKELIKAYFYHTMPASLLKAMPLAVQQGRASFLHNFYAQSAPNQFLAGFVSMAAEHSDHPWIQQLVLDRFNLFIRIHLLPLEPRGPIHVVGSVGTIFAGLFRQALQNHQLLPGSFIQDPARRLFEMHLEHE
jgi:glucosamine kinase